MAVKFTELESQCRQIINDVKNGNFVPVYLLMGTEPYYPDLVCDEIIKYALTDSERDFNQTVFYGLDTDAGTVASECRSYPMMAERRLVVLKEAQSMKTLEDLATYAADPMESTVLVILMHGASADKRRALYKNVQKKGVVLVSDALRDYEMPQWITSFYKSRGLDIEPAAAALLAEYAGTDMSRIMLETEKMQKNLPEGTVRRRYSIEGQVQGVGFRYRARYAAQTLELTGWVENEDDGSVTLEVQGDPDKFMRLFAMIQKSDYIQITGIRQKDLPPDPWERGFSVKGY